MSPGATVSHEKIDEEILRLASVYDLPDDVADQMRTLVRAPRNRGSDALSGLPHSDTLSGLVPPPTQSVASQDVVQVVLASGLFDTNDATARYERLVPIGQGGMGEVFRVRDHKLKRKTVMKIIRAERASSPESVTRFIDEAQITSQLQHPGVVAVHDLGMIGDRVFFTMKEVKGRTLSEVIAQTHRTYRETPAEQRNWEECFRGLIGIFQRVCEPVAYAHSRGLIHRDLKPSNVMIGDFGEVTVIDWGLAKVVGKAEPRTLEHERSEVYSDRLFDDSYDTQTGSIVGTPAYMPPEQARGELESLAPATDVYSLGMILYQILEGSLPFGTDSPYGTLLRVIEGVTRRPGEALDAPEALQDICMRALSTRADERFADAGELARAIVDWREGGVRRERARYYLEQATALLPQVEALERRALELEAQATVLSQSLPLNAPLERKRPVWALQDEAAHLRQQFNVEQARIIELLDTSLGYMPTATGVHEKLADIYRKDHEDAERMRDPVRASAVEVFLRKHNRGAHDAYLAGKGTLCLRTEPARGAKVEVHRYVVEDRRLVARFEGTVLPAPIERLELDHGSYLLVIRAPGRAEVRYPVHIGRLGHWNGVAPGEDEPRPVYLPEAGAIDGEQEAYVPAGPFICGGDPQAQYGFAEENVWVDGFVMQRDPVTHRAYVAFLNALVLEGRTEEAHRYVPRAMSTARNHAIATPMYRLAEGGVYALPDRRSPLADYPVVGVTWWAATAYAAWLSEISGLPWRLPTEVEWAKAARGVDGRYFPWGDYLDPTWCAMLYSAVSNVEPAALRAHPADVSPYGIYGLGGNVRDWCADAVSQFTDDTSTEAGNLRVGRGGGWYSGAAECRAASRTFYSADQAAPALGFRLVRSLPAPR